MRPRHLSLTSPGPLRILSTAELLNMPAPSYLIETVVPNGGLIGLYGPSGAYKSFLAVDLALSVAIGVPWQGKPTQKGFVLYIGAEGGTGLGKRALAWMIEHGIGADDLGNMGWLIESIPVDADSEQMEMLINRIVNEVDRIPILIIIDTMARCFDGDENETEDMGRFIAGVDQLRHRFGCAVLIVHHTRLDGARERGNTAFRGAADTMILVAKDGKAVTVSCNKQKDDEEFAPIELQLEVVDGTESCVLRVNDVEAQKATTMSLMLDALRPRPLTWVDWMKATGLSPGQMTKHLVGIRTQVQKDDKTRLWAVIDP